MGNYGSFFVLGLSASYGVIGAGIENRWGSSNYKKFGEKGEDGFVSIHTKIKTSGFRAYITFRF